MTIPRGRVEAIWIKRAHRGPMDPVGSATLIADRGVENSVDRSRRRQITLLETELWQRAASRVGATLDPGQRRANILLRGITLVNTRKRVLAIGQTRVVIGGETTPCERMEEVWPGLQNALRDDWGGGAFAQVTVGGIITVGDEVSWVDDSLEAGSAALIRTE